MSKPIEHPAIELASKLRSAALAHRMLRLSPTQVAVLMQERIYAEISAVEAEEIRRACRAAMVNHNDISSETSGYGNGTAEPGTSAGSNVIPLDVASRGASRLLREEVALTRRRKKH
jgi:hypothetical protein